MTNAYEIMEYASCETGWGRDKQLEICLDFINQMNKIEPDFEKYVQRKVDADLDTETYFVKDES